MAQVFAPSSNSAARFSIVALLGGLGLLLVGLFGYGRSPWVTDVGRPVDQPIPFSHKHHVTDDGIDCRYCHTTVESAAFAGMPSTQTCMNCHSQIWAQSPVLEPVRQSFASGLPIHWNRVNTLPDFVYFDHSIHVQKGVSCTTCHGPVDQMALTYKVHTFQMSFCLDCHQDPSKFLGPDLVQANHIESKISCSTCHR